MHVTIIVYFIAALYIWCTAFLIGASFYWRL